MLIFDRVYWNRCESHRLRGRGLRPGYRSTTEIVVRVVSLTVAAITDSTTIFVATMTVFVTTNAKTIFLATKIVVVTDTVNDELQLVRLSTVTQSRTRWRAAARN